MVLTARQSRHVKCCVHLHMINPERPGALVGPALHLLQQTVSIPPKDKRGVRERGKRRRKKKKTEARGRVRECHLLHPTLEE